MDLPSRETVAEWIQESMLKCCAEKRNSVHTAPWIEIPSVILRERMSLLLSIPAILARDPKLRFTDKGQLLELFRNRIEDLIELYVERGMRNLSPRKSRASCPVKLRSKLIREGQPRRRRSQR